MEKINNRNEEISKKLNDFKDEEHSKIKNSMMIQNENITRIANVCDNNMKKLADIMDNKFQAYNYDLKNFKSNNLETQSKNKNEDKTKSNIIEGILSRLDNLEVQLKINDEDVFLLKKDKKNEEVKRKEIIEIKTNFEILFLEINNLKENKIIKNNSKKNTL